MPVTRRFVRGHAVRGRRWSQAANRVRNAEIVQRAAAGEYAPEIARVFGVGVHTIYNVCHAAGQSITRKPIDVVSVGAQRRHNTLKRNAEVWRLYADELVPQAEIARRFGVSRQRIEQIVRIERNRARVSFNGRRRNGTVIPGRFCGMCGDDGEVAAHHARYEFPNEVVWLCSPCHVIADVERRRRERASSPTTNAAA